MIVPLFIVGALALIGNGGDSENSNELGMEFVDLVCVYKNGEKIACEYNTLTNNGMNLIRTHLTSGSTQYPINITLGTGAAVAAGDSALNGLISDTGLGGATCTYGNNANNGNWSCAKTFTATGTKNNINLTGLYTADGTFFAGTNFANTNLQNNDQLTINWTLAVS